MRTTTTALVLFLFGCASAGSDRPADWNRPFDLLISNARIVDGTGNPWFHGDIGIRGDRIASIGHLDGRDTRRTIDASGRVVAPGFIDLMGQSSLVLITNPASAESKIR